MTERNPLNEIWLSQPVIPLDISELEAKYKWFNAKQWVFLAMDWLAVVFVMFAMALKRETFTQFWLGFFMVVTVSAFVHACYNTWLRRFALRSTEHSTAAFLQQMQLKLQSSRKISLLGAWVSAFIYPITIVALLLAEWSEGTKHSKLVMLCLVLMVFGIGSVVFFVIRAKRFAKERNLVANWLKNS